LYCNDDFDVPESGSSVKRHSYVHDDSVQVVFRLVDTDIFYKMLMMMMKATTFTWNVNVSDGRGVLDAYPGPKFRSYRLPDRIFPIIPFALLRH
jgi:hypothetical protein